MDALVFWKSAAARRAQAAAAAGRKGKVMHQSLLQPVLLTWPFLLWGIIIIACYSMGIQQLASIAGPIATFNMVRVCVWASCHVGKPDKKQAIQSSRKRLSALMESQLWREGEGNFCFCQKDRAAVEVQERVLHSSEPSCLQHVWSRSVVHYLRAHTARLSFVWFS
jgi:hypothetical protein